jgi:hypothetical protein
LLKVTFDYDLATSQKQNVDVDSSTCVNAREAVQLASVLVSQLGLGRSRVRLKYGNGKADFNTQLGADGMLHALRESLAAPTPDFAAAGATRKGSGKLKVLLDYGMEQGAHNIALDGSGMLNAFDAAMAGAGFMEANRPWIEGQGASLVFRGAEVKLTEADVNDMDAPVRLAKELKEQSRQKGRQPSGKGRTPLS